MTRFASTPEQPPEATRGLHQYVVDRLGQMIASGEFGEDAQVRPEVIGEQLGASRVVVREALRVLEAKGMVRPRPKTGTRVLPMSQWNVLDQDVMSWRIKGPGRARQLEELTDLRIAVELYAARMCAEHATEEQIARLYGACDAMAESGSAGDHSAFTAADVDFHSVLLDASGNSLFQHFAAPFAALLHAREDLRTLPDRVDAGVVEAHRRIVRAIEARDPEAAETQSRTVIETSHHEMAARLAATARRSTPGRGRRARSGG